MTVMDEKIILPNPSGKILENSPNAPTAKSHLSGIIDSNALKQYWEVTSSLSEEVLEWKDL